MAYREINASKESQVRQSSLTGVLPLIARLSREFVAFMIRLICLDGENAVSTHRYAITRPILHKAHNRDFAAVHTVARRR